MVESIQRWFMGPRYDACEKHILRFILKLRRKIEADKRDETNRHFFASLFVG